MKKYLYTLLLISCTTGLFAKKVKFAVNMAGQTISANGIHVAGDFQTAAGFSGGDWNSGSTLLTQEGSTTIYSTVVTIPAFTKYEYKFINGDQFYEAEFVPVESRVGYNFNDNRWLYVDSLSNDTTFVGAVLFAGNAPYGLKLTRFFVDMQNQTVAPKGVHVAGTFQGTDPAKTIMYNFQGTIYEIIAYVDSTTTYQYKFYNGNLSTNTETVPNACVVSGNRQLQATKDTLLDVVCFSACTSCSITSINKNTTDDLIKLYPNPTTNYSELVYEKIIKQVYITDVTGSIVKSYNSLNTNKLTLNTEDLNTGIYFITILDLANKQTIIKWIVK